MSGNWAHKEVTQRSGEEEDAGKVKIKQVSTNTGMKRRRKARHRSLYCFSWGTSAARKLQTKALWWGYLQLWHYIIGGVCVVTHVREDEYSVATHPVSGLCRFGHCGSHHCTCRQSVDACSHSIAVRDVPVSSGVVSKYIWGELLNFRHGSAKITKGSSKEKVQYYASQGQILSFAITLFFCSARFSTICFFWKSNAVSIWEHSTVIFRVTVLVPHLLELASRCPSTATLFIRIIMHWFMKQQLITSE